MNEHQRRVIRALKTVPEKRLMLISLAWEIVGPDGEVVQAALDRIADINMAKAEAEVYTRGTQAALRSLEKVPASGQQA